MAPKLSVFLIFVVLLGCALHTQALTQISNCLELQAMKDNLAEDYELVNDIDCSGTASWNGGAGFEPVGTSSTRFAGIFNGQGYQINGLLIERSTSYIGLFGYADSIAQITSVGLINTNVKGSQFVGGLVGWNSGLINNAYTLGNSTAEISIVGGLAGWNSGLISRSYSIVNVFCIDAQFGGLVGRNDGSISNCYAAGNVTGLDNPAGGLVGWHSGASIVDCYATGYVSAAGISSQIGGLIGVGGSGVSNSYWNLQTSGQASSFAGVGKITPQMYQRVTFVGWDFITIWWLHENRDYPKLRALTPPPVQVIQPISDKTNAVGELFSFIVPENTMQDISDPSLNYTAGLQGGNPLPPWLTFTTSTRAFSGTPLTGAQGNYTIEVIATNDDEYSEPDFFILMITNRAPQQNIPLVTQSLNVGDVLSYTFPANSFSDGDFDPLNYTAQLNGGGALPGWFSFNTSSFTFSGIPLSGNQGVFSVQVIIDDGFGGSVSDAFTLTVNNQPPTVQTPIATQYATNGQLYQFVISGSTFNDVDGDSLNVTATSTGGGALPVWLTFVPGTQTFSGTPMVRDAYPITVTADDGFGGQVSANFDVIVPNQVPVLVGEISSQEALIDGAFSFSFADDLFSDPDNDVLQYSAMQESGDELPSWLNFDGAQREFFGTPSKDDKGSLVIDIIASDGYGGNATASFGVTVFGDSGSGGLTGGQIAAVVISIIGSVLGMLYTCYKFHKKRKFYKGESTKGKSEHSAEMSAI